MAADEVPIIAVSADRPPLAGDDRLRSMLGGYLAAAVPRFYELIPLERSVLHQLLGDSVGVAGSEFENSFMAGDPQSPAGIVACLPLDRLHAAQQAGTIALMRHIDRKDMGTFRGAVAEYSSRVEPIDGRGQYLSRVTVAAHARGQGLGRRLVQQVISLATGGDLWLHVAFDNAGAIALYEGLGFEFASASQYESRAMRRPGTRSG